MSLLPPRNLPPGYGLPEPNAIYRPKGRPVRLALHRDPDELVDIREIYGLLREANGLPKGMVLFTIDGHRPNEDDYTYRMWRRDFEMICQN